jgi:hypothetical protein
MNNRSGVRRKHFLVAALAALCTVSASAQTSATLVGTVRDPSGAVVPKAAVQVTDVLTGAVRATTSGDAGNYVIS